MHAVRCTKYYHKWMAHCRSRRRRTQRQIAVRDEEDIVSRCGEQARESLIVAENCIGTALTECIFFAWQFLIPI